VKRTTIIIHPILLAAFPILFFFSHNITEITISQIPEVVASMMVTTLFVYLSWIVVGRVLGSKEKAGLIVSLVLLMFFGYGHIQTVLLCVSAVVRHRYLLPIWTMLLALGTYYIVRTRRSLTDLTRALNFGAAFLVVVSVINIGRYESGRIFDHSARSVRSTTIGEASCEAKLKSREILPDIYYIIFDRYASQKVLAEFFDYDNSEFIDYLVNKGFYVASESRTNYVSTFLSLASSLNMEYLDCLKDKADESSRDITVMLQDYKVWRTLKLMGYTFVHFGGWPGPTKMNRFADMNFNLDLPPYLIVSGFSARLLGTTFLGPFINGGLPNRNRCVRVLRELDRLEEMPRVRGPKFVFAHVLVTHTPYMFDQGGKPLSRLSMWENNDDKEGYLNQLTFINKWARRFINEALTKSDHPPVIIMQSDEGPYGKTLVEAGAKQLNEKESLRAHAGILNAYYLPGVDKHALYGSISPVNSFRMIFNLYFGTDYELLEDKTYVSIDPRYPFRFADVTDALIGEQEQVIHSVGGSSHRSQAHGTAQ